MTPELLAQCGTALFGDVWGGAMAEFLDVSPRTLRRWANGSADIPANVLNELHKGLIAKRAEVEMAIMMCDMECYASSPTFLAQKQALDRIG